MKYFTPALYSRFQARNDDQADAADADWELAADAYGRHLDAIWPMLPPSVRSLLDDFYLHDAEIVEIARQGQTFVLVLRLDPEPRELMVLTYSLSADPVIDCAALPPPYCSTVAGWMYDEIDAAPERGGFTHRILLSNGWELELVFHTLQVVAAPGLLAKSDLDRNKRATVAGAG